MLHIAARIALVILLAASLQPWRLGFRSLRTLALPAVWSLAKLVADSFAGGWVVIQVEACKEILLGHTGIELDVLLLAAVAIRLVLPPFSQRYPRFSLWLSKPAEMAGRVVLCAALDVWMLWATGTRVAAGN
jgi:hypothetical protein